MKIVSKFQVTEFIYYSTFCFRALERAILEDARQSNDDADQMMNHKRWFPVSQYRGGLMVV